MCTRLVEIGMLTYKIHFKFSNLKHGFCFCFVFSETAHDIQKVSRIIFLLKGLLWAPFTSVSSLTGLTPTWSVNIYFTFWHPYPFCIFSPWFKGKWIVSNFLPPVSSLAVQAILPVPVVHFSPQKLWPPLDSDLYWKLVGSVSHCPVPLSS